MEKKEPNKNKKVLMICNLSQNIYTFRLPLIKRMQELGYDVSTLAFDNKYEDILKQEGVKLYCINDKNRSLNPLKILTLKNRYCKIIKEINPDMVFTFQLKPNIFGALAAKKAGVSNIYSMVEGAGDAFIKKSLKWKVINFVECKLYKKAFKNVENVFFLNKDDIQEFISRKLLKKEQAVVINGIGVDLEKFKFKPVEKSSNKFIMIARMLETKGIFEYCKVAELVKKSHPEAEFLYLGAEGSVKISDIQNYIDAGTIKYLGTAKDVKPFVESSIAMILPSRREGMPMTIMEAEAIGRAIITSNGIGCKETVEDGFNGYRVDCNDVETMANHCIELLENKDKAVEFGKNSRKFAETHFDQKLINSQILEIINKGK